MFTSLAVAAVLASTPDCPLISFSRRLALARTSEEVCVRRAGTAEEFALRRTSTDARGGSRSMTTSTGKCKGVLAQLQALEALRVPQVDLPAFGKEAEFITLDGAGYTLTTPALYDGAMSKLVVQSNVNTPLARWIDKTLTVLAACWVSSR